MPTITPRHPKYWCRENDIHAEYCTIACLHRALSLGPFKRGVHPLTMAMAREEVTSEEKLGLDQRDLANTAVGASILSLGSEGLYCPCLCSNHPVSGPSHTMPKHFPNDIRFC